MFPPMNSRKGEKMKLNKKTAKAAASCLLLLLLYGCASDSLPFSKTGEASGISDSAGTDSWSLADDQASDEESAQTAQDADESTDKSTEVAEDTAGTTGTVTVYLCGAVKSPGVYELPEGSRVYEAIEMAGGLKHNASSTAVNQAQLLTDGEMIEILTEGQATAQQVEQQDEADSRVNLNTASAEELKTLPGIGDAKAASILAYREQNGAFASIEDIKKIEGIKDGVFANIKDLIRVE